MKLALLLVVLASLPTAPALSGRHAATPPAATEIFRDHRQLALTPMHDYVVNLRREQSTKAGQRATLKIVIRAPSERMAKATAEAQHPGYRAINAHRQ